MTLTGNEMSERSANHPDAGDEDAALLRRVAAGQSAAFTGLVDRYGQRLYRAALALVGNAADAEDVVQETFAGAFEAARRFRGEASVKTWLLKILLRQAARIHRKRRKWRFLSLTTAEESTAAPGPAERVDAEMDVPIMLRGLSAEHRQVIVLRELQGLSYEEMAETLGVPRGTVESRLHRARRELIERFGRQSKR
jgi:RNA polymerase sigma-70 factor (ECF subfamily)